MKKVHLGEKLYSAPKAFEMLTGRRVHPTTCWRWSTRGIRGIRLKTVCLGGRMLVSLASCRDFIDAVSEKRSQRTTSLRDDVLSIREQRAASQAKAKLQELLGQRQKRP